MQQSSREAPWRASPAQARDRGREPEPPRRPRLLTLQWGIILALFAISWLAQAYGPAVLFLVVALSTIEFYARKK